MATLKLVSMRLKSVKNIRKITQSMKMVSAAKFTRVERDLQNIRPYGEGARKFYKHVEVVPPTEAPQKIIIAMTSDKGLCGAAHSGVARMIRNELIAQGSSNTKIVCVGDKSRGILQHLFAKNFIICAREVGRRPPTFLDASKLANAILRSGYRFNFGKIVYNKFKSIVSYSLSNLPVFGLDAVKAAPKLDSYDELDDEILQNYLEYSLASLLYYAMIEGATSEQSSRMSAMDNASKNAGEMIGKLTLSFNRGRQAQITRELIEIISGAAALS